jgi:hypothetical protein
VPAHSAFLANAYIYERRARLYMEARLHKWKPSIYRSASTYVAARIYFGKRRNRVHKWLPFMYPFFVYAHRALHDEIKVHVFPLITLPLQTALCKHSAGIHFLVCCAAAHVRRAAAIFGSAYAADRRSLNRDPIACVKSSHVKPCTFGDPLAFIRISVNSV